jgi:outer membrane protein OmpA-like peptidoglycan-associated protein
MSPPHATGTLFSAHFNLNSSSLHLAKTEIGDLISAAKSCPNLIKLTGHTCNLGSDATNQKLGLARAKALGQLLIANGIAKQKIVISSMGMQQPAAPNDTQTGQALNRRVELSCLDQ